VNLGNEYYVSSQSFILGLCCVVIHREVEGKGAVVKSVTIEINTSTGQNKAKTILLLKCVMSHYYYGPGCKNAS
jgi:hypothetical protein